ncbi:uncharacterized protein LOC106666556 isoform X3 [Cimex lectularius]|uniref:Uncharacterized protein n=1 Tax=Cimex lectularius TaxID=79782 RepID=A0A8I6RPY0_CIMLE|nr:uncharacterized protein LOC106666556 isoform X3 [Cimex lectularius]
MSHMTPLLHGCGGHNSTMALSRDILATFKAERQREKVKEKAAARYLRVRSLLDQADKLIAEAQLPRQMKNKFAAKILRARRELDLGDDPTKISENVHDIVVILRQDVKSATKLLDMTLSSLKKDLETLDERKDGELLPRFTKALAITQKQIRLPKMETGEAKVTSFSPTPREYAFESKRKAADAGDSPTPKEETTLKESKQDKFKENKSDFTSSWYENETDEDRKRMEMELSEECGTLDTLHFALRILNEMGRPDLSQDEVRELEMTMKRTKKMLLNRRECQKLRGPLETLQYAMELPKAEREPAFSTALQSVHKAVNAFEVLDNLNSN